MSEEQQKDAVELIEREPQPMLSIRATIPVENLGAEMGERQAEIVTYMQQHGIQPDGHPFVGYHTFGRTETDMEFGIPVIAPATGQGRIQAGTLPGGAAITTLHIGAHDTLGQAYARLQNWLVETGREPAGAPWEFYGWIDPGQAPDPTKWADVSTWHTRLVQWLK